MKGEIFNLYKKSGETPLERIERFKDEYPDYRSTKMSYAGRLDPMAEGVLIIMLGEENKKREEYLSYSKEYIFDILFGVKTDTFDVLGRIVGKDDTEYDWPSLEEKLSLYLSEFTGRIVQQYPPFSSKTINGKPMFELAREGKLDDVEIPTNEVEVYEISPLYAYVIAKEDLAAYVFGTVTKVKGDFRQQAIFKDWLSFFEETKKNQFYTLRVKMKCSSGTYVRGIVNDLGKRLGMGAVALKIVRTKVGLYRLEDSLK